MMTVLRYFLEIDTSEPIKKNVYYLKNSNIKIEKKNNFKVNKFFYKQIGADHFWRDRLIWTDKEWLKYISNSNLETFVISKNDDLIGYYEQEYHPNKNEIELINMGVLKEFRGQKYGSLLLNHVITGAEKRKTKRVWVHTCSLDHKHALNNYKSKGFKIFKEEKINFVA